MSKLDDIFKTPQPNYQVHGGLYRLYMQDVIYKARTDNSNGVVDEEELSSRIRSIEGYLVFLGELKDAIELEIDDVKKQIQ